MVITNKELQVKLAAGLLLLLFALFPASAWAAEKTAAVSIAVEKRITGDTPPEAAAFTFTLTPDDAAAPMPDGTTAKSSFVTCTGAGTVSFAPITYTEPDDYYYTVREVSQSLNNYTMDPTEYTVLVRVTTDDAGNLTAAILAAAAGSAEKQTSLIFSNQYSKPNIPSLPQTGDTTNITIWIILAVVSGTGILGIVLWYRKTKVGKVGK